MTENAKYGVDDGKKGTTDRHRCTRKQESESREVVLIMLMKQLSPIMANSTYGQGHRDKYLDISIKMFMYYMKPLILKNLL